VDKLLTSRIIKLKSFLNKKELQNILILSDVNIFYLTGFYGKDSGSILLFTENDVYLLVSFLYSEKAKKSIDDKKINIVSYKDNKYRKLSEILGDYKAGPIGIEGNNISLSDFLKLEKLLSRQGKKLLDITGAVEKLRLIKDRHEVSKIKGACKITDRVFKNIIDSGASAVNNLSEIELALKIEELLVKNGSEGKSFDIIVAYGRNSSMPHHLPQNIKSKDGLILVDFGCRYNNYCSDMTRTVFTGDLKKSDKFKKIYDIVLEAQQLAIEDCREGINCAQMDMEVRKFICSRGYGENFVHGLGHGVGLEVHEEPKINAESKMVLKENMVITIEPGIYIEDFGGIRIEDMVLVGKDKCEVLYGSTKEYLILN
jgi:Xaa-Pro aminopeptidase